MSKINENNTKSVASGNVLVRVCVCVLRIICVITCTSVEQKYENKMNKIKMKIKKR